MKRPTPSVSVQYVTPDGRLTPAGFKLIEDLARMLADHEARLAAGGL
jgi:hypothetical protein